MTAPVGRVPLTDEELDEIERGWLNHVGGPGLIGKTTLALIAELRASRAQEAELAAELSVLRPALREAKGRIDKAMRIIAEHEADRGEFSFLGVDELVRAALTGVEDTDHE